MIADNIKYYKQYTGLHPRMEAALAFIRDFNEKNINPGRADIDGDHIFALISQGNAPAENGRLEAHRRYIDLHFVVSGCDKIGFRPLDNCTQIGDGYNEIGDYILFDDPPEYFIALDPGDFVICFPQDAHVPLQGKGAYAKIVVKIEL